MVTPARHKFVVEITDMEMGYTEKRVKEIIRDTIDRGMYDLGHSSYFENLQVKSYKKVLTAKRGKS